MSYTGLRQSLWKDIPLESPPPLAYGRAAVRVQLVILREAVHAVGRAPAAPAHAHRREEVRVPSVQQEVHAVRPPRQTREDAQRREEG